MKKLKSFLSLLLIMCIVSTFSPINLSAATKLGQVKSLKIKEVKKTYRGWAGDMIKTKRGYTMSKKKKTYSYKAVQLSWKKVSGANGYEVYRYGNASKKWHKVKTIKSAKTTTYYVPELFKGTKVKLKVVAYKNTSSGKVYGAESSAKSYKSKKDYELTGTVKTKKYNVITPKGWYRFASEDAFVIQNQYRTAKGLEPLAWSEVIYEMAKIRSKECSVKFSHTRPNGSDCSTVVEEYFGIESLVDIGLSYRGVSVLAENIAIGQGNPKDVMQSWKKSASHYKNLMGENKVSGAISLYVDKDEQLLWVANFSSHDYDEVKEQIENGTINENNTMQ